MTMYDHRPITYTFSKFRNKYMSFIFEMIVSVSESVLFISFILSFFVFVFIFCFSIAFPIVSKPRWFQLNFKVQIMFMHSNFHQIQTNFKQFTVIFYSISQRMHSTKCSVCIRVFTLFRLPSLKCLLLSLYESFF